MMADETLGEAGEGLAAQFDAVPADVAALYDDWVITRYDADLAAWGYDAPVRAADMMSMLMSKSEGPVLDAGCGSGLVGAELQRRGLVPIIGGDFSAASVETARSRGLQQSRRTRSELPTPLHRPRVSLGREYWCVLVPHRFRGDDPRAA
jgi:predicted TPR repeat methyltransferase